ncbi:MAG: glycosyltransferase family 2 protein [Dysgonamonadaceae bacterium]|jgi:hypothetical protein|nr:glycosyltransferase family 2 protein [Dysgonamonadaceae bacterium]MDD3309573.1 glycosyltransferase family 2 protein [Dysgonamonadaceae bacterium]MDD3901059.1 glycosyltransferase family 2 protein [Dysgonamonadaceae bacterium]MDD4399116.1 glycosyltransferase family 2 protein [Dysgonamonadaceae bacterium]MEA5080855.1 glycosyltransferase family 2 protein [Dysgonamonadaceae bacterium]
MKTAVIILNWNGKKLLETFLPIVISHSISENSTVIVADNGSTDDSVSFLKQNFPQVPLILFEKNYGFAEGYNKAIEQVDCEYVVLLNSDVKTTDGWLSILINHLDSHPETACVQPKIKSYNNPERFEYAGAAGGFIDKYGYPFCRGRLLNHVEIDNGQYDETIPVFWATGACLCIRRNVYLDAGGLDKGFFAHMEEIDLCWRLNSRGLRIECIPTSEVYHIGGASLNKENPQKTYLNFRNNLLMLYKNVPQNQLKKTMFVRNLLDLLAMIHFALFGKWKNALAVLRAVRDFRKMKIDYLTLRNQNLSKTTVLKSPYQLDGSFLWHFYIKGEKTYKEITKTIHK